LPKNFDLPKNERESVHADLRRVMRQICLLVESNLSRGGTKKISAAKTILGWTIGTNGALISIM